MKISQNAEQKRKYMENMRENKKTKKMTQEVQNPTNRTSRKGTGKIDKRKFANK